jgi:hypothetical protein
VSQKKTLQQSKCDHVSKIIKFGYELIDGQMNSTVELYGCTKCDATSEEPLYDIGSSSIVIKEECDENCDCFGCKVKTLQMNPGDAKRDIPDKKWQGELAAYRDARAQGIQPAGTTMHHVEEAHKASETLGKAYNADAMPKTKDINKRSAEVLKEVGMV